MTGCGNAVGRGLGARLSGNNEFSKLKNRDTRRRAPGSENPSTDTEWTAAGSFAHPISTACPRGRQHFTGEETEARSGWPTARPHNPQMLTRNSNADILILLSEISPTRLRLSEGRGIWGFSCRSWGRWRSDYVMGTLCVRADLSGCGGEVRPE